MRSRSPESFIEDRVAQLQAISERRNDLLREMYHLIRRRQNAGSVLTFDEEEESELHTFLDRFDLKKNPETGTVAFLENEMYAPTSSRRTAIPKATRSKAKAKSPSSEPVPERRSTRRDPRKTERRSGSRALMDVDEESASHTPTRGSASKPIDLDLGSDDLLVLTPSDDPPSSRHYTASVPPQSIPDDDDELDELDLIGSISVSKRSMASHESKTPSRARSRSHSSVIEISDSPEPEKVVRNEGTHQQVINIDEDEEIQEGAVPLEVQGAERPQSNLEGKYREHDHRLGVRGDQGTSFAGNLMPGGNWMVMGNDVMDLFKPQFTGHMLQRSIIEQSQMALSYPTKLEQAEKLDIQMEERDVPHAVVAAQPPRQSRPQLPFVPTPAVQMFPHGSVVMPTPSSPMSGLPIYKFDEDVKPSSPTPPELPSQVRHHFSPNYVLPPLKALPVEFHRRGKLMKLQRKREKEREKNEKGSEKNDGRKECKEEWAPMGVNRWGATVRANPVWKRVARATKCLSTKEWNVAVTELRLIRTLEHVEVLKDSGHWSFRQPKKQRGVGGLNKTHRDYLMDEMKWMYIDFREERRWKLALAYNLSTAVLEWHAAGSLAERVNKGICVLWKRPHIDDTEADENVADRAEDEMLVDPQPQEKEPNPLAIVDYGSDDDDEDEEPEKDQGIIDVLEPTALVQEAFDNISRENDQPHDDASKLVEPKVEDVEDTSALQSTRVDDQGDSMDVDVPPVAEEGQTKTEVHSPAATTSLKPTSGDPILGSIPAVDVGEAVASSSKAAASKPKLYAPLREHIAYSDPQKLFLDFDDLELVEVFSSLSTEDNPMEALPPPSDLSAIFPDLPQFGMLDVAPPIAPNVSSEGRKRSEKRSDKDDPNKRAEDTTYTKLAPLGKFMYRKPTLLGPLRPAKCWKQGQWSNVEEGAVSSESDGPFARVTDDTMCDLFEGNKPGSFVNTHLLPPQPKDAGKRVASQVWTERDDNLLKTLAEKYPNNWPLISDSLNATGIVILSDRRTPWDCLERWCTRWGPGTTIKETANTQESTPVIPETPPPPSAQMTTRNLKRLASAVTNGGGAGGGYSGQEPKKLRRHVLMQDAIRKASKKRDQEKRANANQRKPSAIHDTHGQYSKMPKLTPAELSRMKTDKEQEAILTKRRQEEARQQAQMREQAAQRPPNMQMLQQQQQQASGAPRPPGMGIPAGQVVPQIRSQVNISQQQRIPTPMSAVTARLSPQQMMQVQAQARAMAQAQAQAQTNNLNGVASNIAHMSPPYVPRAATSSPAQSSPPRDANTPSNVSVSNPPRPPSAQAQPAAPQVPGNAMPRPPANMGHYFPIVSNMQAQYTQEQMEQTLRLQTLLQAQRQVGLPPQGSSNGSFVTQS